MKQSYYNLNGDLVPKEVLQQEIDRLRGIIVSSHESKVFHKGLPDQKACWWRSYIRDPDGTFSSGAYEDILNPNACDVCKEEKGRAG